MRPVIAMPVQGIQTYNRRQVQRQLRQLFPGDITTQAAIENLIEGATRRAWSEAILWAGKNPKELATLRRWPDEMRQHASNEHFKF